MSHAEEAGFPAEIQRGSQGDHKAGNGAEECGEPPAIESGHHEDDDPSEQDQGQRRVVIRGGWPLRICLTRISQMMKMARIKEIRALIPTIPA